MCSVVCACRQSRRQSLCVASLAPAFLFIIKYEVASAPDAALKMKTKQFGRVKEFSNKRQKKDMKYKKFVGNKVEGQGFADRRKKKIVQEYKKILRKEGRKLEEWSEKTQKIYTDGSKTASPSVKKDTSKPKMSSLQKAEMEWKKKKSEKEQKRKEVMQRKEERDAALARYENKKREKHKKLSKKNYKGQPILSSRMDVLLEQIEKLQKT